MSDSSNELYPDQTDRERTVVSGVYVFGDSLVDPGNALRAAEFVDDIPFVSLPEDAPSARRGYFEGRFTDGYSFADLISNKLLLEPTKTTYPYGFEIPVIGAPVPFVERPQGNNLNFAYGGAQARQGREFVPDLDAQLDAYRNYPAADPNALYLITIGGNDIRRLVPRKHDPVVGERAANRMESVAAEIAEEVGQLFAFGARHVVVTGIPDIGLLPRYIGSRNEDERRSLATQYAETLDGLVTTALGELALPADAELHMFDLLDFSNAILADPGAYRLTNVTEARTLVQRGALDPVGGGFLFFDQIHPSGQAHALLAAEMLDFLPVTGAAPDWPSPEPSGALSLGVAVAGAIEGRDDADAFTASLVAGQTYMFDLLGLSSGSGSLADPRLRIVDGSGAVLAEDDDNGLGLDAQLEFVAPATADYAIQVASVGAAAGSYLLRAGSGDAPHPGELNDPGADSMDQNVVDLVGVSTALDARWFDFLFV